MSIDTFLLSADTTDLDYPEVRPTLDLNFARVKALDSRITFTRASGGSYTGADGLIKLSGVNEARFDHNPVTGESLGLLVEESRTNLLTYSEQFDNAAWTKSNIGITTNTSATTAPDGTNSAEKLVENTASNVEHFAYVGRTASNETVTLSVFAKAAERGYVSLSLSNFLNAAAQVIFNLSNGAIVSTGLTGADYTAISATTIAYPNGWYRCILTATKGTVNTTNNPSIIIYNGSTTQYTGDGTSGIYIWGAQLEAGAFPTSYIPTIGSTRTRDKDTAIITQNNFSWYNGTEGTILLEHTDFPFNVNAPEGYPGFGVAGTAVGDSFYTIQYFITTRFGGGYFLVRNGVRPGGAYNDQVGIDFGLAATGSKVSFAFKENNFAAARNGILMGTDNLGVVPDKINVSMLIIGLTEIASNSRINCHCKYLKYYPKRLPNQQLQALTR